MEWTFSASVVMDGGRQTAAATVFVHGHNGDYFAWTNENDTTLKIHIITFYQ